MTKKQINKLLIKIMLIVLIFAFGYIIYNLYKIFTLFSIFIIIPILLFLTFVVQAIKLKNMKNKEDIDENIINKKRKSVTNLLILTIIAFCICLAMFFYILEKANESDMIHYEYDYDMRINSTLREYCGDKVKGTTVLDLVSYVESINQQKYVVPVIKVMYNDITLNEWNEKTSIIKNNGNYSVILEDENNDGFYDKIIISETKETNS